MAREVADALLNDLAINSLEQGKQKGGAGGKKGGRGKPHKQADGGTWSKAEVQKSVKQYSTLPASAVSGGYRPTEATSASAQSAAAGTSSSSVSHPTSSGHNSSGWKQAGRGKGRGGRDGGRGSGRGGGQANA